MSVAIDGAKNAVLESLVEVVNLSEESREALQKLTIKEILILTKDIAKIVDNTIAL